MSYNATLDIDGKTFGIYDLNSVLEQKYDKKGRPVSGVRGGYFDLIIEGTEDDLFSSWISDPTKKKDGTITVFRFDQESKFKQFEFKGAYLIRLIESFNTSADEIILQKKALNSFDEREHHIRERVCAFQAKSGINYIIYCEITAEKIKIDGVEHDNKW